MGPLSPTSERDGVRAVCENARRGVCHAPPAGRDLQGSPRPLCQEYPLPVYKPHETDPGEPLLFSQSPGGPLEKAVLWFQSATQSFPSRKVHTLSYKERLRHGVSPRISDPSQKGAAENGLQWEGLGTGWFLPARFFPLRL